MIIVNWGTSNLDVDKTWYQFGNIVILKKNISVSAIRCLKVFELYNQMNWLSSTQTLASISRLKLHVFQVYHHQRRVIVAVVPDTRLTFVHIRPQNTVQNWYWNITRQRYSHVKNCAFAPIDVLNHPFSVQY